MITKTMTAKNLVTEIKRTLGLKGKGAWRMAGMTRRIIQGDAKLNDLITLADSLRCSLPHLVTGCRAEYDGDLSPAEAVEASIRHAGWPIHEAATIAGYRDHRYFLKCLREGTIAVRSLLDLALAIGVTPEELFSDSECVLTRWEDCIPDEMTRTRESILMGWSLS